MESLRLVMFVASLPTGRQRWAISVRCLPLSTTRSRPSLLTPIQNHALIEPEYVLNQKLLGCTVGGTTRLDVDAAKGSLLVPQHLNSRHSCISKNDQ